MSGFDLSKEDYSGDYTEVADGAFSICGRHKGGHLDFMPEFNNRAFAFKVKGDGQTEHLLLYGLPNSDCMSKVRKLEEATGLQLKVVLSQGDWHHMSLKDWLEEYPEAKFIMSSVKFPKTRNGVEILANETYKAKIELVETPEDLAKRMEPYEDTVQFYGFDQFMIYEDQPWMSKDNKNPSPLGSWSYIFNFGRTKVNQRFLAIWGYHVPSKQLIYEHNFDIFMSKETVQQLPFPMNWMMKVEAFGSLATGPAPMGPKEEEACKVHCRQMSKVLALDVRAAVDFHSLPTVMCKQWASKDAYQKEMVEILRVTGEDDPTGETMFKKQNASSCVIS